MEDVQCSDTRGSPGSHTRLVFGKLEEGIVHLGVVSSRSSQLTLEWSKNTFKYQNSEVKYLDFCT